MESKLNPMGWGESLVLFAVPALLAVLGFHVGIPALIGAGLLPFYAYFWAMVGPLALMLVAALIAFQREGHPLIWAALRERFRLLPMTGRAWLWALGAFVVMFLGYGLFAGIDAALIANNLMPLPNYIPAFIDPRAANGGLATFDQSFGGLKGNWLGFITYAILLFFNIIGEEFWWRGYILPRQELFFGKWTWVVHGVLWAFFHMFKWWDVLALLPVTLTLTYVVSRTKNNTIGIILHFVFNGLGIIPILLLVLGVMQ